MKKLNTCILLFGISLSAMSQNINYEIIKDEPIEPRISINLDYFNMDYNSGVNSEFSNLRFDNLSLNLGVYGHVKILDPLEIDFDIAKSIFILGKLAFKEYPGNTEINVGANLWLSKREVVKKSKVVLDVKENSETTTTTYIMVPSKVMKRIGVRGGLYSKSSPFNYKDYRGEDGSSAIEQTKITSFGIYAGLTRRKITNVIIKDDKYGRSSNSIGRDIYFDALIVPINRFKDLNNASENVSEEIRSFKTTSPMGFRLGYRAFQVEKKPFTGKKFGMSANGEIGYKPYQGWFVSAGIGITLVKN